MRLTIRLIQAFPFDAEPHETVGQLRERLRVHLTGLLEQHHGDAGDRLLTVPDLLSFLCCCGDLPDDGELDLHLSCNGQALNNDSATLASVGVAQGSEVVVLSKALAVRHGQAQGVTCVNDAFRELAAKVGGGVAAGSEELALKNSKPFALTCRNRRLGELGPGWPLFFEFVCYLIILCLVLCLAHVPALVFYSRFDPTRLEHWIINATEPQATVDHSALTVGNTGPDGTESIIPAVCATVSIALMLASASHMSSRQRQLKQDVDSTEIDPSDFALLIEGLPADATRGKEIREFIEQNARKGQTADVVTVVVGFDILKFKDQAMAISSLREQLADVERDAERSELSKQIEQLSAPLASAAELVKFLPNTGYTIAVLRSQYSHRECLQEWDTWREWLAWSLPTWLCEKISETPRFRGTHAIRITRAANPSDYLWENLGASDCDRGAARLKTYVILTVIFALCTLAVWGMRMLQVQFNLGSWFSLLVVLPMVLAAKFAGPIATRRYVMQQKHKTKTERDLSLMVKYSIFALLIYCVVPLALAGRSGTGESAPSADTGYYRVGGLYSTAMTLLIVNNFVLPLIAFAGSAVLIRRFVLHCGAPCRDVPAMDLDNPPPGLTQAKLRRKFEPPDINMARITSQVMKKFFLGVFFLPMFPLGILMTAGGLVLEICAYRYQLLRLSKRPYRQSHDIAYGALRLVFVAAGVVSFTQYVLLTPSITGAGQRLCGWVVFISPCVAAVMTFLPSRANQLIFGAVYLGIRKDTESDVDYYVAQKTWPKHQKYHTTHAVYLRLEQLMLMAVQQKRPGAQPPPWDVRTGNFPSPAGSAAASEEGVPAGAAAGPGEVSPAAVGFASAGAPAAPGDLAPGGLGDGAAVASAPPPVSMSPALPPPLGTSSMPVPLSEQALHGLAASLRGEPDDDEDEGEETMALAAADAATLALEEAKYRVPLSMMGEAAGAKGDEDEESSAQSTDESESSIDLEEGTPSVESALLAPGVTAEVRGLTQAPRYNGTTCLVLSHDSSSAKWVVRLDDGAKARLPGKALNVPSVVLAPGGQARIHGMIKAEQFNGTLAKLLEWDASAEKWRVKLFTGAKATVAAQNLAPEEGLGFAF